MYRVTPNHVHVIVTPRARYALGDILKSWKGFTARRLNDMRGTTGPVWQPDYFDRAIRDDEHLRRATEYTEMNPVVAGLCAHPEDWPFSSARRRTWSRCGAHER